MKSPADDVEEDGLVLNANTSTTITAAFQLDQYTSGTASTINNLSLNRIKTAPGYQIGTAWFWVNGGIVKNFRSKGDYIVGPNGGSDGQGILISNLATGQIQYGVISDGYFNGVKEGIDVSNGVTNAATLIFANDQILNQTWPIFDNGAFNLDISYIGGSLSTAGGLALVEGSASASVTASYADVIGSGSATTATVSNGTLRLRKTDRIAFSPSVVLTPSNNDVVNFSGTPTYTGVNVISGSGAGQYIYRGTGTTGWIKLN